MAIDTHDPAISKRRRIVYTGLVPYLEDDELYRAMWIWENQFAQAPAIQYRHFIEAITTDHHSLVMGKQLYLSLVSASLAKDSKTLKPDPYNEMIAYKSPNQKKFGICAATMVFSSFLKHLILQLDHETSTYFYQKITTDINKNMLFDIPQQKEIRYWLRSRDPSFRLVYGEEQLRQILHYGYLNLCDIAGPVIADQMFATAVEKTKNTPEGREFDPKDLL